MANIDDYVLFCEWVAREILDEENWELNCDAFPELACRRLHKLGIIDTDGKCWYQTDSRFPKLGQGLFDRA